MNHFLDRILRSASPAPNVSIPGVVILLIGALLALPASTWSKGDPSRALILRLVGLLLTAIGALLALRML